MKSLLNTNVLLLVMLAPFLMLVSCSQSYKLSEGKYAKHLNLVKADKVEVPSEAGNRINESTTAEFTLIQTSLTGVRQKNVLHGAEAILPFANHKHLQSGSVAFSSVKTIKQLNPEQINSSLVKYRGNPWDDNNDLIMNPPRIILLSGIFSLSTVVCLVYAAQIPFLNFVGYLMAVAAIVFLVIWVLSLRDYHTY